MAQSDKVYSAIDKESKKRVFGKLMWQENMFEERTPCIVNKRGEIFLVKEDTINAEEVES